MENILNAASTLIGAIIAFVITRLLAAIAIIIVGNYAISLVTRTFKATSARTHVKQALIDLGVAAIQAIGILIILSGALQSLGLDSISLAITGSISLIALGVATAASGNLGDIIAGVFLASDPDFGTGFVITTSGITGHVEHLDLRKTRLRTEDGKLHIVPNKSVENNAWIVEARPNTAPAAPLFRGRIRPPHLPGMPRGQQSDAETPPHETDPGATQPHPTRPPDDLPPG